MMRRPLLATVALVAFAASADAHADQLPKQMLGNWCGSENQTPNGVVFKRGTSCSHLEVKRNGFNRDLGSDGDANVCRFKRIKQLFPGTYLIRANCNTENTYGNEDMVFQIIDNQLVVKRITPEKPEPREPEIFIWASPPTSQIGLVLKGKYYWFSRGEPDDGRPCDVIFNNGCYMKSNVKFVYVTKDIISINGNFGCSPRIIPDTSNLPDYEYGYGECTSEGWKSISNR